MIPEPEEMVLRDIPRIGSSTAAFFDESPTIPKITYESGRKCFTAGTLAFF
jgi:hypothetical protein